eukprot:gb/GFBE01037005.1/.p1 GENE.gb/GFBE01037005.1/~~gb/GFBE01037005.1/.p1  ORF type:complete len:231 (+),score=37.38 gb/GFBE01037005.1/:1-693(+)
MEDCKSLCIQEPACCGVEYSSGRCEVWTRPEGIEATRQIEGRDFTCLSLSSRIDLAQICSHWEHSWLEPACAYKLEFSLASGGRATACTGSATSDEYKVRSCHKQLMFQPVDGGEGRACRGSHENDNSAAYFTVVESPHLKSCWTACLSELGCKGVEFSSSNGPRRRRATGRCELWTRAEGIQSSKAAEGFACQRLSSQLPDGVPCRSHYLTTRRRAQAAAASHFDCLSW